MKLMKAAIAFRLFAMIFLVLLSGCATDLLDVSDRIRRLRLGMRAVDVERILGKPSEIVSIGSVDYYRYDGLGYGSRGFLGRQMYSRYIPIDRESKRLKHRDVMVKSSPSPVLLSLENEIIGKTPRTVSVITYFDSLPVEGVEVGEFAARGVSIKALPTVPGDLVSWEGISQGRKVPSTILFRTDIRPVRSPSTLRIEHDVNVRRH